MACTLATVQTAACSSGIGKLTDPTQLLQVIAQNAATWAKANDPSLDISVGAIRARACTSGIGKVTNPQVLLALIASNLCDQAS